MDEHWHHHHDETPEWAKHEFGGVFALLEKILKLLKRLLPGPPASAILTFEREGVQVSDISVTDDVTTLTAAVAFADDKGDATSPTGSVSWSSSDGTLATVDGSGDPTGLTAAVTLTGTTGTVTISASDSGSGVTGSGSVTITAGPPATADVSFSQ